jgi:hypothetical protein
MDMFISQSCLQSESSLTPAGLIQAVHVSATQNLRGQVKSGQRGSCQNRPTDVARDKVVLSHLLLIRQVCFGSPAPWSAFQDVTVV